jgi:hypothetical protein
MSARIYHHGATERPRRTFETPVIIHQEWPEHIARCRAAIRQRWDREDSAAALRARDMGRAG